MGRHSKEGIGCMVEEGEKYMVRLTTVALHEVFFFSWGGGCSARITAKNGIESYAYNPRNSLTAVDKHKLETAVNDTIKWLDASQEGSKERNKRILRPLRRFRYELVAYVLFIAISCENSMALRVDLEFPGRR